MISPSVSLRSLSSFLLSPFLVSFPRLLELPFPLENYVAIPWLFLCQLPTLKSHRLLYQSCPSVIGVLNLNGEPNREHLCLNFSQRKAYHGKCYKKRDPQEKVTSTGILPCWVGKISDDHYLQIINEPAVNSRRKRQSPINFHLIAYCSRTNHFHS